MGTEIDNNKDEPKSGSGSDQSTPSGSGPSSTTKEIQTDLENRVSVLNELMDSFEDPGPILEIVVWHDGKDYRSVIGGAEGEGGESSLGVPIYRSSEVTGGGGGEDGGDGGKKGYLLDLSGMSPMTDYRKEKHWEKFGKMDLLTYSVNILDDGKLISVVTCCGSHGGSGPIL